MKITDGSNVPYMVLPDYRVQSLLSNKLRVIFFGMSSRFTIAALTKIARKCELVGIVESAPRYMNRNTDLPIWKIMARKITYRLERNVRKPFQLSNVAKSFGVPYFYMESGDSRELEFCLKSLHLSQKYQLLGILLLHI